MTSTLEHRIVIPTERSDEGSQAMRIQRSFTSVQDDKFTKKVFGQHLYRCYAQYEKQHFGPAILLLYSLTFYCVSSLVAIYEEISRSHLTAICILSSYTLYRIAFTIVSPIVCNPPIIILIN